jgi:hypothetical protein
MRGDDARGCALPMFRPCAVESGVACTAGLAPARRAALRTGISETEPRRLRGSRNAGGFGRLFGPSASLKTHHDNKKQYSEWSGCQCRALPSRTSQVAAHQRGSGESTPARRRDQGLVGEAQEGTRHEFERFRQFVIGPIASSGPATIWRHLGNRREWDWAPAAAPQVRRQLS